jgi:hypothetical protein
MTRKMNTQEFVAYLEEYKQITRVKLNQLVRGVIFECAENVIVGGEFSPGTPVDTGYARAAWWVSVDGDGTPPHLPEVNQSARGKDKIPVIDISPDQLNRIMDVIAGQHVSLNNNARHIVPLENGHSQQAPTGMVRQTANAIHAIVAKVRGQLR